MKRAEDYAFFFTHLTSPDWIPPLREAGFFTQPPPVEYKGEFVRLPEWPESQYLARMAKLAPELVSELIREIPETDNSRVREDLVSAMTSMPPEFSIRLLDIAIIWARSKYHLLLPERLGELVSHLAKGGYGEAALELARVLLEVIPPQEESGKASSAWRARPRFWTWTYAKIIKEHTNDLVAVQGIGVLRLFTELLNRALEFDFPKEDLHPTEDLSAMWLSEIDGTDSQRDDDVRIILAGAIRLAAERLLQSGLPCGDVIDVLNRYDFLVFKRLILNLLRLHHEDAKNLIPGFLVEHDYFVSSGMQYEYNLLLAAAFQHLNESERAAILSWIETGKAREDFGEAPEDYVTSINEQRQLARLALIQQYLPPKWQERYDDLVARYGPPKPPEPAGRIEVRSHEDKSPKTPDELEAMSLPELVTFMREWRPDGTFDAPTWWGLHQVLAPLVASKPSEYAVHSLLFKDVPPAGAAALIRGLDAACKAAKPFSWKAVLDLCQVVASSSPQREKDTDLESLQADVQRLIESGFEEKNFEIPVDLADVAWGAIEPLTRHPDPSPDREKTYSDTLADGYSLAINSLRGRAVELAIKWALWQRRHQERAKETTTEKMITRLPSRVVNLLEACLDTDKEQVLAIKALLGRWFPWLVYLDRAWANSAAGKLFPTEPEYREAYEAAWTGYLLFCPPYDEVLDILKPMYAASINHLGTLPRRKNSFGDPDEHLAQHLMVYYWRGKFPLDSESLTCFWEKASPELRGKTIAFVGQSLDRTKDAIQPEILDRLKVLWAARFDAVKRTKTIEDHIPEMNSFGYWFSCGKFDVEWALAQLSEALKFASPIADDSDVVKRLSDYASARPHEVIRCFDRLIKSKLEEWSIYGWRDEARRLLTTVMSAGDADAREAAENAVHYLGSQGHFEFRDLLGNVR